MNAFFKIFFGLFGVLMLIVGSGLLFAGLPRTRALVCQRLENQTIDCQIKQTAAGFVTRDVKMERLQNTEVTSAVLSTADVDFTDFQINFNFAENVEVFDRLTEDDARRIETKVNNFIESKSSEPLAVENRYQSRLQNLIGSAAVIFVIFIGVSILKKRS